MIKIKWSIEEAVALFDLYKSYENYRDIPDSEIDELSRVLRHRAELLGLKIDEKYRNKTGLRMQLECIQFIVSDGTEGIKNVGQVFRDVFKLYEELPSIYSLILEDFNFKYKQ